MKFDFDYMKRILEFMNEFSVHKVTFKSENYIQIEISKPFDYADDYFRIYIKDTSVGYINQAYQTIYCGDFKNLDEFINSDLYYKLNKYVIKNKIVKF